MAAVIAVPEETKRLKQETTSSESDSAVFDDGHIDTTVIEAEPLSQKKIEDLAKTPFWRGIRFAILALFWAVWLAMLFLTVYFIVNARDVETEEKGKLADQQLMELQQTYMVMGPDDFKDGNLVVVFSSHDDEESAKAAREEGYLSGPYFAEKLFKNSPENGIKINQKPFTFDCDGNFVSIKGEGNFVTTPGSDNLEVIQSLMADSNETHFIEGESGPLILGDYGYSHFVATEVIEFKEKVRGQGVKCEVIEIGGCQENCYEGLFGYRDGDGLSVTKRVVFESEGGEKLVLEY